MIWTRVQWRPKLEYFEGDGDNKFGIKRGYPLVVSFISKSDSSMVESLPHNLWIEGSNPPAETVHPF